jgi:hypothetical protein
VRRQAYDEKGKLRSVPVVGATVSGVNDAGAPLAYIEGGTSATTDAKGAYAIWDERYSGADRSGRELRRSDGEGTRL